MTYDDFIEIVKKVKDTRPILFELESDKTLSEKEISEFERENHINIPKEYKKIIMKFGGGYFGLTSIYSLDKDSSFYILSNQNDIPTNYLAISDNGCGDYFVLKIFDGCVQKEVFFFDHEMQQIVDTEFMDVYEFLVTEGLKYKE